MNKTNALQRLVLLIFVLPYSLMSISGCTFPANVIGGAVGSSAFGGTSPSHQIEQVYYLGVFDPQEQLPPTIYRVIVRGQAGAISAMKFGSGWVPANLVDSLNTHIGFNKDSDLTKFSTGAEKQLANLKTGRRLMLFGPEGFREAPKDFRLAIVMGASPEKFFQAIDESVGTISQVQMEQLNADLRRQLLDAMSQIQNEWGDLKDVDVDTRIYLSEK